MGKSKNTKLLILINTYVPQGFSNNKFESQVIDKKKRPFPPMHSYLKKKKYSTQNNVLADFSTGYTLWI